MPTMKSDKGIIQTVASRIDELAKTFNVSDDKQFKMSRHSNLKLLLKAKGIDIPAPLSSESGVSSLKDRYVGWVMAGNGGANADDSPKIPRSTDNCLNAPIPLFIKQVPDNQKSDPKIPEEPGYALGAKMDLTGTDGKAVPHYVYYARKLDINPGALSARIQASQYTGSTVSSFLLLADFVAATPPAANEPVIPTLLTSVDLTDAKLYFKKKNGKVDPTLSYINEIGLILAKPSSSGAAYELISPELAFIMFGDKFIFTNINSEVRPKIVHKRV